MELTIARQNDAILAELKAIKALIAEIGIQKMGVGAGVSAQPQQPQPQPPTPYDEFLALVRANKITEAERHLNGCDSQHWAKVPADLLFNNAKLFVQACRLGLVDLETTAEPNLQRIFYQNLLPEDRAWFKNHITPATAARLRTLKMIDNGGNANHIVEFLCMAPCCPDRMQFAWELLDTEGDSVFPLAKFWRHSDFLKGDTGNPAYVRWWANNVMAGYEGGPRELD